MYIYIYYIILLQNCVFYLFYYLIACIFIILLFNLQYTANTFTAFIPKNNYKPQQIINNFYNYNPQSNNNNYNQINNPFQSFNNNYNQNSQIFIQNNYYIKNIYKYNNRNKK